MKGSIFAAAALVGSAMADGQMHRRHEAIHNRRQASSSVAAVASSSSLAPGAEETCGCTTKVITYYGSPTLIPIESTSTLTSTIHSTSTSTMTVTVTPSVAPVSSSVAPVSSALPTTTVVLLPTPGVTSFSSTGTYTIPATTLTVTDTTTVCGATSTEVPSGTHTIGGVTTVVETETVITCPYATVKPTGTTVTSVIEMTTYTCPAAGTYTIVPGTVTTVPTSTVIVYPTPQTITPGTYTQPETVVTVTRTDYTYVCPYSSSLASATAPVVAATTTAAPAPVAPTSAASASSSSSSSASASPSSSSKSSSGVTGAGQYGMTFSPYTSSGGCMSQSDIKSNLQVIKNKGFNLVRVYSTDCNGLEYIGSACKELGMNIIMGVFIDSAGISAAQEQVDAIAKWAQWGMVELIVVGNEAISGGFISASDLASFISSAKSTFQAAGYTGHVTTTEPINIWEQYGASTLCSPVDIVGANIHPFFNSAVTAEKAGEFALEEFKVLEGICNKDVVNLETGWPNAGDANGAAVPGVAEQETAIKSIAAALGSKSIFFSYADDTWKKPGAYNVEQHWGCASVF
ncbi:putative beta-glucosidase btgE [Penicillium rolfsii]|nr:putative beta-glucosidase btgE [Penicillium rolfsii]